MMTRPHLPFVNVTRTLAVEFNGACAWKKFAQDKSRRFDALRWRALAAASGLPMLRSTLIQDFREGLAFEASRMDDLRRAGFLAPQVLARDENGEWIVTSHIGEDLRGIMRKVAAPERRTVLTMAAEQLATLHAYGQYHGRPTLRDLTLGKKGIGFIDLEHDALRVMGLADIQARDAVAFVLSASKYARDDQDLTAHLVRAYLRKSVKPVREKLQDAVRTLSPMAHALHGMGGLTPRFARVLKAFEQGLSGPHSAPRGAVRKAARPA
jgi:tRNA A-37 threonylcarbamoyl transferase component Bud32